MKSLEELAFRDQDLLSLRGFSFHRSGSMLRLHIVALSGSSGSSFVVRNSLNVLCLTSSIPRLPGHGFSLISWQKRNKTKKACLFFVFCFPESTGHCLPLPQLRLQAGEASHDIWLRRGACSFLVKNQGVHPRWRQKECSLLLHCCSKFSTQGGAGWEGRACRRA